MRNTCCDNIILSACASVVYARFLLLAFSRHTKNSTVMATNVIVLCIALVPACVIAFGKYSADIKVSVTAIRKRRVRGLNSLCNTFCRHASLFEKSIPLFLSSPSIIIITGFLQCYYRYFHV